MFFVVLREGTGMQQGSYDAWKIILPAVLSGLLAWLYSSLTKVSKNEHKESIERIEKLVEKQSDKNSKFEAALNDKVSRAELKESMQELRHSIQEMRTEVKEDFKALRDDLRRDDSRRPS